MLIQPRLRLAIAQVFFFHLGNAAVLPLLGQVIALGGGGGREGLLWTCVLIMLAQLTAIVGALVGQKVAQNAGGNYQMTLAFGYALLPVRCACIVALLQLDTTESPYALAATQIFDGASVSVGHQIQHAPLRLGI